MVLAKMESVLAGVRAMLARELIERGFTQRRVAQVLGITPSAVTLYTRGRRGRELAELIGNARESSAAVRDLADQIAERRRRGMDVDEFPLILDTAYATLRRVSQEPQGAPRAKRQGRHGIVDQLKSRIEQEQLAAQRNMTLAVAAKDELTRILFRQIATDSMRHADIIGAVINHLEKPTPRRPPKDEIMQIEAMMREEDSATEKPLAVVGADPALRLLLGSINMDELKHSKLLRGLLEIDRAARSRSKSAGAP